MPQALSALFSRSDRSDFDLDVAHPIPLANPAIAWFVLVSSFDLALANEKARLAPIQSCNLALAFGHYS